MKMTMQITISHNADSIDPASLYTDEQFAVLKKSLENEYETAILAEYPDAEIDFSGTDTTYSTRVTGNCTIETHDVIQDICEKVFETGNFWV